MPRAVPRAVPRAMPRASPRAVSLKRISRQTTAHPAAGRNYGGKHQKLSSEGSTQRFHQTDVGIVVVGAS